MFDPLYKYDHSSDCDYILRPLCSCSCGVDKLTPLGISTPSSSDLDKLIAKLHRPEQQLAAIEAARCLMQAKDFAVAAQDFQKASDFRDAAFRLLKAHQLDTTK